MGDACDASKDAACPDFGPRLNKAIIASCRTNFNVPPTNGSSKCNAYRPGQCYCDKWCRKAEDCCRDCPKECQFSTAQNSMTTSHTWTSNAAAAAISASSTAAQAAVASLATQHRALRLATEPGLDAHDCGNSAAHLAAAKAAAAAAGVATASAAAVTWTADSGQQFSSTVEAEAWLQQCQAADKGPPAQPYRLPINWVQAVYCTDAARTVCTGNEYGTSNVWEQVNMVNDKFARTGIQFDWDGKMQVLYVNNPNMNTYNCQSGSCKECTVNRAGDTAVNVMTTPTYIDGYAVGQAMYPWFRKLDAPNMPACADWIQVMWSSLPGLGARSSIDNGLMDGGGVLAHEIGHYLGLYHTWYQGNQFTPAQEQCSESASLNVNSITSSLSDGVRDTPAISLNYTGDGKIIRFVNCSMYEYTNTSALAQQSCTSASPAFFPQGDRYYNPYFNLMSYGDKTCIRVITPGQAARMRCSHRCFRLGNCNL